MTIREALTNLGTNFTETLQNVYSDHTALNFLIPKDYRAVEFRVPQPTDLAVLGYNNIVYKGCNTFYGKRIILKLKPKLLAYHFED